MGRIRLIPLAILLCAAGPCLAEEPGDAKIHFDKGVDLFKLGDFEGALVEFRAAYDLEPHYKVRYNIGVTLYKLNRWMEARDELESYLSEGGKEIPEDRDIEVKAILFEVMGFIGTLEIACNVDGAEVRVDGVAVGSTPLVIPMHVDVGEHEVSVTAAGYEPFTTKISVPGGTTRHVEVELSASSGGPKTAVPSVDLPKATGRKLFIAGEALTLVHLLSLPVAAIFYIVDEKALGTYLVPSLAWGGVIASGMILGSQLIAARSIKVLGSKESKQSWGLRVSGWVFWGGTILVLGGHYLVQGLFNRFDGDLAGCGPDECSGTRSMRDAFAIATYFLSGALAGALALTWALGTAGWVFTSREVEAASAPSARVTVVPLLSAVPGGGAVGIAGSF